MAVTLFQRQMTGIFFFALVLSWAVFCTFLLKNWREIPVFVPKIKPSIRVSVVVPVRNEAKNIVQLLEDLNNQTLPFEQFEVLIMDDASTDETALLVQNFQAKFTLKCILVEDASYASPKKRAISKAIQLAQNEWIITTDGDCRVPSDWLENHMAFVEAKNAKCVVGGVKSTDFLSFFDFFQAIETASLVGTGAATLHAGYPTMCNGANFGYNKLVFNEVGGFQGNDQLASGDDEFLLHKISVAYPNDVHFLKDSFVATHPQKTLSSYIAQRQRWASKWKHYADFRTTLLAVWVFAVHFSLLIVCFFGWKWMLSCWGIKLFAEFLFLNSVANFLGYAPVWYRTMAVQLFYPFVVLFFGILAQKRGFIWRGRNLK